MSGQLLLVRIERVYRLLEKTENPYGARAWFARKARVYPYSVSRWLRHPQRFQGPPLSVLELLEKEAGIPDEHVDGCDDGACLPCCPVWRQLMREAGFDAELIEL